MARRDRHPSLAGKHRSGNQDRLQAINAKGAPPVAWHQKLLPGADTRPIATFLTLSAAKDSVRQPNQAFRGVFDRVSEGFVTPWLSHRLVENTCASHEERQQAIDAAISLLGNVKDVPAEVVLEAIPFVQKFVYSDLVFNGLLAAEDSLVFDKTHVSGRYRPVRGCVKFPEAKEALLRLAATNPPAFTDQIAWIMHRLLTSFHLRSIPLKLAWLWLLLEFDTDATPGMTCDCLSTRERLTACIQAQEWEPHTLADRALLMVRLCSSLQANRTDYTADRLVPEHHCDASSLGDIVNPWHEKTKRLIGRQRRTNESWRS